MSFVHTAEERARFNKAAFEKLYKKFKELERLDRVRITALTNQLRAAAEALEKFGGHGADDCREPWKKCTCGYDDAVQAAKDER